jgi:hypothetical protein
MEFVPYDVLKDALFYLSVPQIMKLCQSQTYLYHICGLDNFWLEYLQINYKNISLTTLKDIRTKYTGYKQIAIKMHDREAIPFHDGMLVPIFDNKWNILGYAILNFKESLTDLFLKIERQLSGIDTSTIWLKGRNSTTYIYKRYISSYPAMSKTRYYSSTPEHNIPAIFATMNEFGSDYEIKTNIPIDNIQRENMETFTSIIIPPAVD